jgi:hypothetical protein
VPAGEIDDPAAAEPPPGAAGDLPRLVELLAREAARLAHHARDVVEEARALVAVEIVRGEALAARGAMDQEGASWPVSRWRSTMKETWLGDAQLTAS